MKPVLNISNSYLDNRFKGYNRVKAIHVLREKIKKKGDDFGIKRKLMSKLKRTSLSPAFININNIKIKPSKEFEKRPAKIDYLLIKYEKEHPFKDNYELSPIKDKLRQTFCGLYSKKRNEPSSDFSIDLDKEYLNENNIINGEYPKKTRNNKQKLNSQGKLLKVSVGTQSVEKMGTINKNLVLKSNSKKILPKLELTTHQRILNVINKNKDLYCKTFENNTNDYINFINKYNNIDPITEFNKSLGYAAHDYYFYHRMYRKHPEYYMPKTERTQSNVDI